jgi:hypothetical protein
MNPTTPAAGLPRSTVMPELLADSLVIARRSLTHIR